MDLIRKAKVIRLRSHHDKYLLADDDESVIQDRNGASRQARWTVEFIGDSDYVRLKSCYGRYLTASNRPYLLGLTGHKVVQDLPARLDSSVEWQPVREGTNVKFRTRYGKFLRANGGTYPYKNSVTHDVPQRTATQDWVLWGVEVVEVLAAPAPRMESSPVLSPALSPAPSLPPPQRNSVISELVSEEDMKQNSPARSSSHSGITSHSGRSYSRWSSNEDIDSISPHTSSPSSVSDSPKFMSKLSKKSMPRKPNGRKVHYYIADDEGNVDESYEAFTMFFEGSNVNDLTQRLEEEMGMEGAIVCTRNILNEQLYPLRLQLPPNNATMNVVVLPSSSTAAKRFTEQGLI